MTTPPLSGRFVDQRVLVTGGGTGIGLAIAQRFIDEGASVTITGRREETLSAVGLPYLVCDITVESDRARLVDALPDVDVVVNNAGIFSDDWTLNASVHVDAPFALARMYEQSLITRSGSIINIASVGGLVAVPNAAAYSASKAALIMMTRSLAVDLGPRGVRVNAVSPGWVRTPMADEEMSVIMQRDGVDLEGAYAIATRNLPLRRPSRPEEIAGVVAFLASADASFITGSNIVVDGGSLVVDVGMLAFE